MPIISRFILLLLLCSGVALKPAGAMENTLRAAQGVLKVQGFYFGEVDGNASEETTQSFRRFQIRNSLPVSGQFDGATRQALEAIASGNPPPATGPVSSTNQAAAARGTTASRPTQPPIQPPAGASTSPPPGARTGVQSSLAPAFPPQTPPGPEPAILPNPAPDPVAISQLSALGRAQEILMRDGYYQGEIDGRQGSRTTSALREFQGSNGLARTGRLDRATLDAMGIEPAQFAAPRHRVRHAPRFPRVVRFRVRWG